MREFASFNPIVIFLYFLTAVLFTCAHFNPISVIISFSAAFTYCAILKGKKSFYKNLTVMPLLFVSMAVINPAFNHQGVTILTYLPSGNPLTAESIYFGLIAAGMLLSVMLLFSCFNEIMTSDKIIYISGKLIPSLSLIFSMTLRAVPRFFEQLKDVARAQKCVGRSTDTGSIRMRIKSGISILSVMITRSLENSVEMADSMKSRGFGSEKRTAFSIYSFTKRDRYALFLILLLSAYIILGSILGVFEFTCFPRLKHSELSAFSLSFYSAEVLLLFVPVVIEFVELKRWKYLN